MLDIEEALDMVIKKQDPVWLDRLGKYQVCIAAFSRNGIRWREDVVHVASIDDANYLGICGRLGMIFCNTKLRRRILFNECGDILLTSLLILKMRRFRK